MHKYSLLITENHLDTLGHVNNATYLELYEQARWEMITQNGYGLEKVKESGLGPVILDLFLTFKAEIRNREKICIETEFVEMKNSLVMTLHQRMLKSDQKVASSLELSVGVMDLGQRKLVRPSSDWLKAIGAP